MQLAQHGPSLRTSSLLRSNQARFIRVVFPLFLVGWISYAIALVDVGPFSLTLLLIASLGLAWFGIRVAGRLQPIHAALLASTLLAITVTVASQTATARTVTHASQAMLGIGVVLGSQAIDWNAHFHRFRTTLVALAGAVLALAAYQLPARLYGWPGDFLPITSQQVASDAGLQRGATSGLTRVSSTFPEPSDLGHFMLWVFAIGYAARSGRMRTMSLLVASFGILISQSLGAIVAVVAVVLVMAARDHNGKQLVVALSIIAISGGVLFVVAPTATDTIGVRTIAAVTDPQRSIYESGRFEDFWSNVAFAREELLVGHGLGTTIEVVDGNVVANAFQVVFIERGLIGAALYFAPFVIAARWTWRRSRHSGVTSRSALAILVVEIAGFFLFAQIYFPPLYFALGFALANGYGPIRGAPPTPAGQVRSSGAAGVKGP